MDDPRHALPTPRTSGLTSLGTLSKLPDELLIQIIHELDIYSLLALERVSKQMKSFLTSTREYQEIRSHSLALIQKGVFARLLSPQNLKQIKGGNRCTIGNLQHAYYSGVCGSCGISTMNVYFPSCERLCIQCVARLFPEQDIWDHCLRCYSLPPLGVNPPPEPTVSAFTS